MPGVNLHTDFISRAMGPQMCCEHTADTSGVNWGRGSVMRIWRYTCSNRFRRIYMFQKKKGLPELPGSFHYWKMYYLPVNQASQLWTHNSHGNRLGFRGWPSTVKHMTLLTQDIKDSFQLKGKDWAVLLDLTTDYNTIWHWRLQVNLLNTIFTSVWWSLSMEMLTNHSFTI